MQPVLPQYCEDMDVEGASVRRARFMIRLAALYYSPSGQLKELATALGMHPSALSSYDEVSPSLAIRIEELLGRERFPRETLRPDLFLINEA